MSHSTDGTTCPINPDSGSGEMDGAVAKGDGHIIVGAGSSCPLTLTVTGQVATLTPGFECPNGESKLVYDEYKWELTGETTSRVTIKATLVAGTYSCAMHSVIEAKR